MSINRRIRTTILVIASIALPVATATAHPSSGIVVDEQGQVFFQGGRTIWKIDAEGKLTKYGDKLGGHWMALDASGRFSRADLTSVERITPAGARPALLVPDGGAPVVVNTDGNLYYGRAFMEGGRTAVGLTRISPDGKKTLFSPDLKRMLEEAHDGVTGLAAGTDGSLYVSTWDAVLKINKEGAVATVVRPVVVADCDEDRADHNPSNRLPFLRGLAVDRLGIVYAAATSCHRLLKIAPAGRVESILKAERPWSPTGVAVHGRNVYVLEYTNANGGPDEGWLPRVRRLEPGGKVTTVVTISRN